MRASGRSRSTWAIESPTEGPSWGSAYKARLRGVPALDAGRRGTARRWRWRPTASTLDPELKDAWGMPAMRVTYKDHPDDLANARFLQDARAGDHGGGGRAAGRRRRRSTEQTARAAPARHVPHGQRSGDVGGRQATIAAHDIPNLFLCDGSSLVTSGRGQPTLTIQALAFRAAEHIARVRPARRDLGLDVRTRAGSRSARRAAAGRPSRSGRSARSQCPPRLPAACPAG